MFPVAFYIGYFPVRTYYLFNALGILAGFLALFLLACKMDKDKQKKFFLFALIIFIPFFIGARLGGILEYLIINRPLYSHDCMFLGPFSLWWGLALSSACAFIIGPYLKVSHWEAADLFAVSIAAGGIFARLACFSNGCCHGIPCPESFPFPVTFPPATQAGSIFKNTPVYPSQLFEAAGFLVILVCLVLIYNNRRFEGETFLSMICLYSVIRFLVEFTRYNESTYLFLSIPQYWAIAGFSACLLLYLYRLKHNRKFDTKTIK